MHSFPLNSPPVKILEIGLSPFARGFLCSTHNSEWGAYCQSGGEWSGLHIPSYSLLLYFCYQWCQLGSLGSGHWEGVKNVKGLWKRTPIGWRSPWEVSELCSKATVNHEGTISWGLSAKPTPYSWVARTFLKSNPNRACSWLLLLVFYITSIMANYPYFTTPKWWEWEGRNELKKMWSSAKWCLTALAPLYKI